MPTRRIKAVVFDFDGTLVDSNHVKRRAYDVAFVKMPTAPSYIAFALARYPDRDRHFVIDWVVNRLRRSGAINGAAAVRLAVAARRRYSAYCRAGVAAAREFPGVAAVVRALAQKYHLAINSGSPQAQLRYLVRDRAWGRYCDLVLGAPATKVSNLQQVARRFNIEPDEIVLVGDSRNDADAAAQFGCAFIHAAHQAESRSTQWRRVNAIKDLPRMIARVEQRRAARV